MRPVVCVLGLVLVLVSACGGDDLVQPAASVRGEKIPVSEVEQTVDDFEDCESFDQIASQQGGRSVTIRQFQQAVLSQLIRVEVLEPRAEQRNVEVTQDDVEQRLEQIRQEFGGEEAFKQQVRAQCLTFEQVDELVEAGLLEEKLRAEIASDTSVPEEELRSHYEQNVDDYRITEVQHILVKQKSLAGKISNQLASASNKKVDTLFAQLARKHSTDESNANRGGRLGAVSPGQFVPEFESAMDELKVGEISEPVKTQFGFHVIRVTGRRTEPFSQVRDRVEEQLAGPRQGQAWNEWLREAFEEANIEVNPRYGEFNLSQQRVVNPTAKDLPATEEDSPER